ncbi:MAG: uroporphyrinogen decarboxylase [Planctomycetes bacterium]|nr:uroporphyrinogen decarboxylase [Planctomycetota bacterium]MCW8136671.1 uroporphyrinogen decarboxylase [Planctomycetota bacterium]
MSDVLHNSRFLKACRGESTDVPPVWLMRQAGRYMPEYRAVRAQTDFLGLCKTPELAAQVTLDAQRILGVDAAILFADLLPILEPMGMKLTYEEGEGPRIHNPLRSPAEIDALATPDPRQSMPFVGQAIKLIRAGLPADVPLIGFAGAPFTLAAYAIEGGGSRNYVHAKSLMLGDGGAWRVLMEKFTAQVIDYLRAQIEWGVQAVQLFDSWVGCLGPGDFKQHVLPWVQKVIGALKGKVPVIYFGTGTATLLHLVIGEGETVPDVLGIDWHTPLEAGWQAGARAVQGNLDPVALFAPREVVLQKTREVLAQAARRPAGVGYIFNLGHGILPHTPVDNVKAVVECVHGA